MTNDGLIWFATQVDRDFNNCEYGDGTRLYCDNFDEEYKIITGYSYDGSILKVKDEVGNIIELINEPDNIKFDNTIKMDWCNWDKNFVGSFEDRSDYEPWAYNSMTALAVELGLYEINCEDSQNFNMFYGK
jgi:hypothetical protein